MTDTAKKNKTEIFETMSVPKALAVMAVPTVLSQVIVLAYNLADAFFIGRTNDPYKMGATSLVLTLFLSLVALANIFGVGGGNLIARLLGKNDREEAKKAASYSILLAVIVALCYSVVCLVFEDPLLRLLGASENTLPYARQYLLFTVVIGGVPTVLSLAMPMLLRNVGYSKEAGIGVALGGVLNIALDPLFMFVVFPTGYEVLGAAVATMLSNVVSMIYFIVVFVKVKDKTVLELPKRLEKLRPDSLKSLYSVGIPAAIILLLFDSVGIVLNRLAASYSDVALASVGIVLKLERLPQNVSLGVCLAMVPLVAYNYARKDYKRMDGFFSATRITVLVISVLAAVAFYFISEPIVRLFIENEETVALGARFLKARAVAIPFMLLGFQINNFTQAVNRGITSLCLSVVRHLVLMIPTMLIFNAAFGIDGLIWSQTVADVVNTVIAYTVYSVVHKKIVKNGL